MHLPAVDRYTREKLSPAALAVLIDIAAVDPSRPLSRLDADWNEVYTGICRNGLIGLAYFYFSANPNLPGVPDSFRENIKKTYLVQALRLALLNRNIRKVLTILNESGIDYLVVKGPAVARELFPEPRARMYNDLDLIIRERNWADLTELLLRHGYKLVDGEAVPPPKVIPQEVNHETKYINAEGNFRLEAHYDDVLRTGLAARDVEAFWQRAVRVELDGVVFPTLCLEDQLIYLCAHAHHHAYSRLNWFSDLVLTVRDKADQLDWQRVIETVKVEEAQVPVYYSLYFVERLFGIKLPDAFMSAVRPDAFRMWLHDRLMPPEKVLSFEPLLNAVFSFYFYPLFQRLLPDFLVMGRRKDKLSFLLHLIAPPRAWLRSYYKLKDEGWIDYYYLLHPLKVAGLYLSETFSLIFRRRKNDFG